MAKIGDFKQALIGAPILKFNAITLRQGVKILLNEASAQIDLGDKVGLVGRNGVGKTSLMNLIAGKLHEDHGECIWPKSWRLAYLSQSLPENKDSAFDFVRAGDERWIELNKLITTAEKNHDGNKLAELYAEMEIIDGYRMDARVCVILKGLGFSENDFTKSVKSFSGGWQMRLQLAKLLISPSDLLLLDEPTNHLDFESIIWLEKWLQTYKGALIVISHDRYFLDHVTNKTLYIASQKLRIYHGNYSSFAKQFHEALILQEKANEKIIQHRAHLKKFVDRFRAKASKAKQAQSRIKAMEKLQVSCDLQEEQDAYFEFFEAKATGYPTMTIRADLGYGDKVILNDVKLNVGNGDRIGIIGVNGAGKSTLLKSIANELKPITGKLEFHPNTQLGYFSQEQIEMLKLDETPLSHLLQLDKSIKELEARKYLGRYGFSNDRILQNVGIFSGGEKARLALALLIWQRPNVLLLDEPTNHLDMQAREALILALEEFQGALLLVSHDRYFVECCVNELWLVKNHRVESYQGSLQDYENEPAFEKNELEKPHKKKPIPLIHQDKATEKQLAKLEREIEKINIDIKNIEEQLADPNLYQHPASDALKKLLSRQSELKQQLIQAEEKWFDLSQ